MRARLALALAALLGAAGARAELPKAWAGTWEGSCVQVSPDPVPPRFGMRMEIGPVADQNHWTWRTSYLIEGAQPDVRDYLLLPTGQPNRFVVAERNGIQIDSTLMGEVLYQHFFLAGTGRSLHGRWELAEDTLEVELPSYSTRPANTRVDASGTRVTSFPLVALQRCTLARQ